MSAARVSPPRIIRVEAAVAEAPLMADLRSRLPEARIEVVERMPEARRRDPEVLEVVSFKGQFLKSCPGTRHYLCCGYQILNFGVQCTLGCTYCILQAYLNQPNLRIFGNIHETLDGVDAELRSHPERLYRIGTGEFTDSMLLDPWTGLSRRLVPFFARQGNAVLELKTKTDFIENLQDLDHNGHTIVAWSLNSGFVRAREESRTAGLGARLEAARRCASWGYKLAFHFDPMIEHEDWKAGYARTVDRLFEAVDPSLVVWISLGAFRFMPDLKSAVQANHPASRILYGEFIRGLDQKSRYFRDIRVEMYSFMVERIRRVDPDLRVYLCMESGDVWREAFGFSPEDMGGLPAMLDRAVAERMKISVE